MLSDGFSTIPPQPRHAARHHTLRLDRLRHRHGLTGSIAASIASLAYEGGGDD